MKKRFTLMGFVLGLAATAAYAEEPAATPTETTPSSPTKKLTVGTEGFFQPGLLLQGWFFMDRQTTTSSTFKLRRAEIAAKGEIVPGTVGYAVMIDPARVLEAKDTTVNVANQDPAATDPTKPEQVTVKQPNGYGAAMQDFFITWLNPYADVSIGQFKIPVSWEGYNSSSKLLFPERAVVSKTFGDKRDLGLRAAKTFKSFGYSAGLFNRAGQNLLDTSNSKDFGLRLEGYPIEGFTAAGVIYMSVGERDKSGAKDRYEGDLRYEKGPLLLQGEYIRARDVGSSGTAVKGQGFYTAAAYKVLDDIQPCVRLGLYDPNVDKSGDRQMQYELGLNYLFRKNEAKLQLAYSHFTTQGRAADNQIIMAAQVAY